MDIETLCIVCNWVNNLGLPYWGLGALGAAAAGFFGGGFFGGSGADPGPHAEDQEDSSDETAPDSRLTRRSRSFQPDVPIVTPLADALHNWAEDVFGPEDRIIGTVAGTAKENFGMHYDVDYVGRDYKTNPVIPPAPRDR
jgi:hypothetical protein